MGDSEEAVKQRRQSNSDSVADKLVRQDLPPCTFFLSTGSTLLDLAISDRYPGGVGSGRITHIYGENSTAKSLLAQEVLGSAQRAGGHAIFEDAETTLDFPRAERLFGLNTGIWKDESRRAALADAPFADAVAANIGFTYRVPHFIEHLFDEEIAGAVKLIKDGKLPRPAAMAVDTFSALTSIAEAGADLGDGTYGTSRAKQMSAAFRKHIWDMARADLTVLAIDQTREKIGVAWGDKKAVSGGKALPFYASTRVYLQNAGKVLNKHKRAVGVDIKFTVEKNKIAAPYREGMFRILFDYGIDDIAGNLLWLKDNPVENGKVRLNGAWFTWGDERMGCGLDEAVVWVEEAGKEKEVEQEVVSVWRMVYAPLERRPRRRE